MSDKVHESPSTVSLPIGKEEPDFLDSKHKVQMHKGNFKSLPKKVQQFVMEDVDICKPSGLYICDGSEEEAQELTQHLIEAGKLKKLDHMENCYLCCTDPADVARVEGKTYIVTENKYDAVPHVAEGTQGILGKWMSPSDFEKACEERLPGCMAGRIMYVIPFSMGPVGSPLSRIGIQLTDSAYVALSMRTMTRIGDRVLKVLGDGNFVPCLHSVGCPRPVKRKLVNNWPCNPEQVMIAHIPKTRKIVSYGSGYGGNSLLGKKCFALRIASNIARDEGWLAEHMLIMSVTNPQGVEKFICAAFPSACGKTNMAMLQPSLPGWKIQCVGDDICWMRFDDKGQLRAINPEAGFFGVAPGTNHRTNPIAMDTVEKNCIFTNCALTDDGRVFWEGLEKETSPDINVTTWLGEKWRPGDHCKAAHPNSRFCCPAGQCSIIHPKWEDPEGVPIDALVFGGRRPTGVPLVIESLSWEHGVMLGAALKSEATAAAEFKGKQIMHDPMAMRPFMGYNFGKYLQHWLDMKKPGRKMPKIFHVNWFRVNEEGELLWPGFGENIRVIDWMCRRCDGEEVAQKTAIGLMPIKGTINIDGLKHHDFDELFSIPKDYWVEDIKETKDFLEKQVGCDLPKAVRDELDQQEERINKL